MRMGPHCSASGVRGEPNGRAAGAEGILRNASCCQIVRPTDWEDAVANTRDAGNACNAEDEIDRAAPRGISAAAITGALESDEHPPPVAWPAPRAQPARVASASPPAEPKVRMA